MKSMLRVVLSLAILAWVVTGVMATGGSESGESATGTERSGVVNQLGMDDPDRPVITVSIGAVEVSNTDGYPPGMDRDNNVWRDLYRDVLGVEFENMWVVPEAQAAEKVNLQIATGDIPDILTVNTSQFNQLVEYGLIADLSEVYETYATDRTRDILTSDGGVAMAVSTRQDSLYAIPYTSPIMNMTPVPWVRFDWLETLGMDPPETTEELYEMLEAFVNDDPDGNGQDDTIGLPLWANADVNSFQGLFTSFNAYVDKWVESDDGPLVFSPTTDDARDALSFLNRAYEDGLLPQDFASWTDGKANEAIVAGKAGVFWWPWWAPYWMGASRDNDPNADWRPIYPPAAGSQTPQLAAGAVPGQFYVANKDFEHPEILVKMTNLFFEKYVEEEDVLTYFTGPNEENFWQFSTVVGWKATGFIDEHKNMVRAIENRDRSLVAVGNRSRYDNVLKFIEGDESQWRSYMAFGPRAVYGIYTEAAESGNFETGKYYGSGTPTMIDKGAALEAIILEEYVGMITGGVSIGSFADFVERWEAAGGLAMTREVNEWKDSQ